MRITHGLKSRNKIVAINDLTTNDGTELLEEARISALLHEATEKNKKSLKQ
jgi:hypothetical protein